MDRRQTLQVYDREYAGTYDRKFLLHGHYKLKSDFEVRLIGELLRYGGRWLDVACGTGWLLGQFPGIRRAGLDLSPAMLERAREANPDALHLREGDFTGEFPDWIGEWDLVTCMWYAYGLVESVADVERVLANLAAWTSDTGRCFIPVCDPEQLGRGIRVPYLHRGVAFPPGTMRITGVTWTWDEPDGVRHSHVVAPPLGHMVAILERHFDTVQVVDYPPWRWWRTRRIRWLERRRKKGLLASNKKPPA